ncbi:hypothetical protein Tco_0017842 [Tanacetum coccineum]
MKTKRNLVPKTTVVGNSSGINQGNVVVPDLRENVCGVGSSNSPKRQCVRQGNVVVRDLHENGYGVDVCGVGSSSSQKRQCVRQANVVVRDLCENVCGVGHDSSPKRQCLRQSDSVSHYDLGLQVPGVPPAFDGLVSWEDVRDDIRFLALDFSDVLYGVYVQYDTNFQDLV